jgi:putative FmdB family regulatory protein
MSIYVYKCPSCARSAEVLKPMAASDTSEQCPNCGHTMVKDIRANLPHAAPDSYARPIHSDALGIRSCQVEEHKRLYPDVQLDAQNRPILDSYRKHEAYMEKRGIVKQPALRQRRGRKIA